MTWLKANLVGVLSVFALARPATNTEPDEPVVNDFRATKRFCLRLPLICSVTLSDLSVLIPGVVESPLQVRHFQLQDFDAAAVVGYARAQPKASYYEHGGKQQDFSPPRKGHLWCHGRWPAFLLIRKKYSGPVKVLQQPVLHNASSLASRGVRRAPNLPSAGRP